eukprot:1181411-Prorocentrum_minimum.AAC.1
MCRVRRRRAHSRGTPRSFTPPHPTATCRPRRCKDAPTDAAHARGEPRGEGVGFPGPREPARGAAERGGAGGGGILLRGGGEGVQMPRRFHGVRGGAGAGSPGTYPPTDWSVARIYPRFLCLIGPS